MLPQIVPQMSPKTVDQTVPQMSPKLFPMSPKLSPKLSPNLLIGVYDENEPSGLQTGPLEGLSLTVWVNGLGECWGMLGGNVGGNVGGKGLGSATQPDDLGRPSKLMDTTKTMHDHPH